MAKSKSVRLMWLSAVAFAAGPAAISEAQAGAFGVREQSSYFTGDAYAGSAAGGDISSMFWNPAATATLPGFNSSSSYTGIIGRATESATGGLFVTGSPPIAPGLGTSSDVGTSALVPASYMTLQLTDRLYAGVGLNAPFGFVTKPDNTWAGSPIATTTKVFSLDANPTIAYKVTPTLTVGAGVQIEYFEIKLERDSFNSVLGPLTPSRSYKADDVGAGATAGVLWQPREGTSLGLGYRSAVTVNVSGLYTNSAFTSFPFTIPGFSAIANGKLTLPDEVTFSARQAITSQLTLLGTAEWNRWSSLGNVSATGAGCASALFPAGTCETLHLNYQDGWFFSAGAEYAYSPSLTLRTGVGYEISPVKDSVRDILLPDSNRVHLSFGASYKWSDKITINAAYSHLFFDDAPFCIAQGGGTSHCTGSNQVLLQGAADVSVDIVSVGVNYKFYGPEPLEPLK